MLTLAEAKPRLDPRRFDVETGADLDQAREVILAATDHGDSR